MNNNANDAGVLASAPVSVAVIGVEDLDRSLEFYAGTVGLTVAETRTWQGPDFERYWHVPGGTTARCVFLEHGADPVGRIQLMEFDAPDRKLVRSPDVRRATGLFNLNIYASDIQRDYANLKSQGYNFWSEPAHNNFGPAVGETLEAAFDGPDGVVINLIELISGDPNTVIGHIIKFIDEYGRTPAGFTSVVTTAHSVERHGKGAGVLLRTAAHDAVHRVRARGCRDEPRAVPAGGHCRTRSVHRSGRSRVRQDRARRRR